MYGQTRAVDGVSFEVGAGEIFGIIGPNGAGKTTTVECLEGLRVPDEGRVRVLGLDPQRQGDALRERIGAQLQESALPARLRVGEAMALFASFYTAPAARRGAARGARVWPTGCGSRGGISGGQRQRLAIALALVGDPEVVFFDELTSGLDPQARRATWDLVSARAGAGQDHRADHALHGGGRTPVRPGADHRPRAGRCPGHPGGTWSSPWPPSAGSASRCAGR